MASLYIKDEATADRVGRFARQLGTTKTDTIRQALDALQEKLNATETPSAHGTLSERMEAWRAANPLPPKVRESDKAFFDRMWGEPD